MGGWTGPALSRRATKEPVTERMARREARSHRLDMSASCRTTNIVRELFGTGFFSSSVSFITHGARSRRLDMSASCRTTNIVRELFGTGFFSSSVSFITHGARSSRLDMGASCPRPIITILSPTRSCRLDCPSRLYSDHQGYSRYAHTPPPKPRRGARPRGRDTSATSTLAKKLGGRRAPTGSSASRRGTQSAMPKIHKIF